MTSLDAFAARMVDYTPDDSERAALTLHLVDSLGAIWCGMGLSAVDDLTAPWKRSDAYPEHLPSPILAGLLAASGRATEMDDILLSAAVTPGTPLTGALLAALREEPDRAERLLVALGAGYETAAWLGSLIGGPDVLYQGIWPTYWVTPAAVAVALACLWEFTPDQLGEAMVIALSLSVGASGRIRHPRTSRWLTLAHAVAGGYLAAMAAQEGMVGDQSLLSPDGFRHGWGFTWTLNTKVAVGRAAGHTSLKPFSVARQTLCAVEAFQSLLASESVALDQVAAVTVEVPVAYYAMVRPQPISAPMTPWTDVAHVLALAATEPNRLYDLGRDTALTAPAQALKERIAVRPARDLDAFYPEHWPARVTVFTTRGTLGAVILDAPGDPSKPLTETAVLEKVQRAACHHPPPLSGFDRELHCLLSSPTSPAFWASAGERLIQALWARR
ncbi:MAG: MmgE/PrpD family protein [Firmicutes bacterium]|nr:MmgE/PrpD family protein [Alicyclobacillaceae bacterium]MCL6498356.1 MmgE/PrpD family protein [Bacillota bacterium]